MKVRRPATTHEIRQPQWSLRWSCSWHITCKHIRRRNTAWILGYTDTWSQPSTTETQDLQNRWVCVWILALPLKAYWLRAVRPPLVFQFSFIKLEHEPVLQGCCEDERKRCKYTRMTCNGRWVLSLLLTITLPALPFFAIAVLKSLNSFGALVPYPTKWATGLEWCQLDLKTVHSQIRSYGAGWNEKFER